MRNRCSSQRGITLVELLIGVIIMGVISTMLLLTWFALSSSWAQSTRSAENRDAARHAVARMALDIRDVQAPTPVMITAHPSMATWSAFRLTTAHKIRVLTQFNVAGNRAFASNPHLVEYSVEGTDLYRTVDDGNWSIGPEDPRTLLASNVVNVSNSRPLFEYTYADASGGVVNTASSIALAESVRIYTVTIHLQIDVNPGHSPKTIDLETTVQPRNLRQT